MALTQLQIYEEQSKIYDELDDVVRRPSPNQVMLNRLAGYQFHKGIMVNYENLEDHIEFQYNPAQIQDDKSTEYAALAVHGRSHPLYQFSSGSERLISFTAEIHGSAAWVDKFIRFSRSFMYPKKSAGNIRSGPDRVMFSMGDVQVIAVMRQCNVKRHGAFAANLSSKQATIDFQLAEWTPESVMYDDVRVGPYGG